jgi:hypothetical protein
MISPARFYYAGALVVWLLFVGVDPNSRMSRRAQHVEKRMPTANCLAFHRQVALEGSGWWNLSDSQTTTEEATDKNWRYMALRCNTGVILRYV